MIGGGSTPEQPIATWVISISGDAVEIERRLRSQDPPILARIERDRLIIDLRTVFEEEESELRLAVARVLGAAVAGHRLESVVRD